MPPMKVASIPPLQVVVGLGMFGAGQILNMGVYKALGKEGVYYGVRLGKPVAWYEGFPFTMVPHPQYVGCVLCIWGVVAVLLNQANINAGLLTIASAWSTFYCVTGLIEHHF
jgi:methylene-fatty-acyl-phospholipid synthase